MKKPGNIKKQARVEKKIPLAVATAIADAIVEHLRFTCEKIDIVGSVRRSEREVGDIDIVLRPIHVWSSSENKFVRDPKWFTAIRALGIVDMNSKGMPLSQRRNVKVSLPWARGVKVDIWIPQDHDYGRIMAIRTGNDKYAREVITGMWTRQQWVGTSEGLRRRNECIQTPSKTWRCTATIPQLPPPFPTEESFFEYFNMKAIAPHLRKL